MPISDRRPQSGGYEHSHKSVSAYIRARLFGPARDLDTRGSASNLRLSSADRQKLLAQILGTLGQLKILRHLSDLAEAARIGVLPLTPDVAHDIRSACAAIMDVRNLLLGALGLKPSKDQSHDSQR